MNPFFQGEAIVSRIRNSGFDIDQTRCKQLEIVLIKYPLNHTDKPSG